MISANNVTLRVGQKKRCLKMSILNLPKATVMV